ncbi:hypothetical protein [uncultured Cohaesibacter sp.]|uniref:hypothetical protein n=1 Tax=uncultured Cohaesibacter sp. TaxID=1002546 RepID=UPI00293114B7|nr:hypothetical protein [uncultured Cohaesibacter sp.]
MFKILDQISFPTLLIACLTLGLAPFVPEPHIWQKLKMLTSGTLSRPIDIFDLLFHGLPWLLMLMKFFRDALVKTDKDNHI